MYWQRIKAGYQTYFRLQSMSSNKSGKLTIKALYGSVFRKLWMLVWYYVLHYRTQLNSYQITVKKDCFTQDSIVNEPLSPERIFASSKSFLFKFVISRFFYCKKFSCDEKKNVTVCDRRKPNSFNPKNDFDRDFSARALCIMVIIKLHPLFIYIMYMYV